MATTLTFEEQAKAAAAKRQPGKGAAQVTTTTKVPKDRWGDLANLIGATYEGFELNQEAMDNCPMTPEDVPSVVCALKKARKPKASITIYYNGTVVWAGCQPLELPDLCAPKARVRKPKAEPQPEPVPATA